MVAAVIMDRQRSFQEFLCKTASSGSVHFCAFAIRTGHTDASLRECDGKNIREFVTFGILTFVRFSLIIAHRSSGEKDILHAAVVQKQGAQRSWFEVFSTGEAVDNGTGEDCKGAEPLKARCVS
jgi:hypothetical protein